MVFDGPTLLLMLLALLGSTWRRRLSAWVLRAPKRVALGLLGLGLGVATLGPFEWLALAALVPVQVGLLLVYLSGELHWRSARGRVALRLATALAFHILFVVLAPNLRLEAAQGLTPLWFVDLVARGWRALVEPLLLVLAPGADPMRVLTFLTPGLAALGAWLAPLQFVWCYLVCAFIARLLEREVFPERAPRAPDAIGWGALLLLIASTGLSKAEGAAFGVALLARALTALFACHGLLSLWALVGARVSASWRLPFAIVLLVLLFIHPALWVIPLLSGVLEVVLRAWRQTRPLSAPLTMALHQRLHRALGPTAALGLIVVASLVAGGLTTQILGPGPKALAIAPPPEGGEPEGDELRLPSMDGRLLRVDRHELPNRRGSTPAVGLSPLSAQAMCAQRGRRLCTTEELGLVCSSGRGERFLGGGEQGFFSGDTLRRFQADCNFGRTDEGQARGLLPSGARPRCRGDWAVYDLVGNANEWATVAGQPSFFGLVGADYRYDDLRLLSCGAYVLVPAPFVEHLDLGAVGGRCCR